MPAQQPDRRREPGHSRAYVTPARRSSDPVLALQRSIGNRAVGQVLARVPVRSGTVQIAGVGEIKVTGGNLEEWAGKATRDWVEVTSQKGKHSGKLEKLSGTHTRADVTVTIAPANQVGEQLSVGGGIVLELKDARITDYAIADGAETWRVADFQSVHRTRVTHKIS